MLAATTEDATEAQYGLTDAQKELIDRNAELAESYRETNEAKQEAFAGINSEYGYYEELWNELQGIVDQNGKVKEGYEERAAFITSTLSEALGIEIDLVDGQIQNYEELDQTIQKVMVTKKAEAMLDADQEKYTNAIKDQDEALKNYLTTKQDYEEAARTEKELADELEVAQTNLNEALKKTPDDAKAAGEAYEEIKHKHDVAKDSLNQLEESYTNATDTYLDCINTIKNHEGVASAVISGDSGEIENALILMENSFIHAEGATRESLEKQAENMRQTYENMKQAIADETPGITQDAVDAAANMVEKADAELQKFDDLAGQRGTEVGGAYASGLTGTSEDVKSAAENVMIGAKAAATAIDGTSVGVNFGNGLKAGIESTVKKVADAAAAMVNTAIAAANAAQDSHSPSKKMIQSGRYFGAGAKIGIEDMTPRVAKAGANMATSALDSFRERMKGFDFSGTVGRIRGIMSGRNLSYSSAVQAQVGYRSGDNDSGGGSAPVGIDYEKMAQANARAMEGMTVELEERELGRVVRKVVPV